MASARSTCPTTGDYPGNAALPRWGGFELNVTGFWRGIAVGEIERAQERLGGKHVNPRLN
jgi:hypothetical protein